MSKHYLIHLGIGNVGGEAVKQITANAAAVKKDYGIDLIYCGLFDSHGGIFQAKGLSKAQLLSFKAKPANVSECLKLMPRPFSLIDTTASDKTLSLLKQALTLGGSVILSNKKPLAGSQSDFNKVLKAGEPRLFYETTVGAGLPVIKTLKSLLATGDEIISIEGCFSGTLGFIFSELEKGGSFSAAILKAKKLGFTEPDPRDDLSGVDVARKALILARTLGKKLEMANIKVEKLYPKTMGSLEVDKFEKSLAKLDKAYKGKVAEAKKSNKVLRYVASVSGAGLQVGIKSVDKTSEIGALAGPDNIIIFRTKRYNDRPLVVKGPGAGIGVTAAGVFDDILQVAKEQRHE